MGVIKKILFRWKKAIDVGSIMRLSTTSTSATWTPSNIVNNGSTLTWVATGGVTETIVADEPIFNLSTNTGTVDFEVYDVSNLINFTHVQQQLSSLDVTECLALETLAPFSLGLLSLDVTNNTSLLTFLCNGNNLTSINTNNNTLLTIFDCDNNTLTSIDISNNTLLTRLRCYNNNFSSTVTNSILASLVSHGLSNGELRYRNNETGQGITDRATLISRGWTITNYPT